MANPVDELIGASVQKLRLDRKMSVEELAAHCDCSPAFLAECEGGKHIPADLLYRIVEHLDCGIRELFGSMTPDEAISSIESLSALPAISDRLAAARDHIEAAIALLLVEDEGTAVRLADMTLGEVRAAEERRRAEPHSQH